MIGGPRVLKARIGNGHNKRTIYIVIDGDAVRLAELYRVAGDIYVRITNPAEVTTGERDMVLSVMYRVEVEGHE